MHNFITSSCSTSSAVRPLHSMVAWRGWGSRGRPLHILGWKCCLLKITAFVLAKIVREFRESIQRWRGLLPLYFVVANLHLRTFYFSIGYLEWEEGRGRDRKKHQCKRDTVISCLPYSSWMRPRIKPACNPGKCPWLGMESLNPSVFRPTLQPMSNTGQGP